MTLSLLAYVGGALTLLGLAVLALLSLGDRSPGRRAVRRHLGEIDRQSRELFLNVPAVAVLVAQVLGVIGSLVLVVTYHVASALLAVCFVILPRSVFDLLRRRRVKAIEAQLNGWLSMMANMLKVTGSVTDAIMHSVKLTRGPLGQELDLLLKELQVGVGLPEALRAMADRIRSDLFSTAATIILIGRTTGGELPTLLQETAAAMRERMRLEGVIRKQTANGRTQLVVLFLSPPFITYLFIQVDPQYFDPLIHGGYLGQFVTAVAVVLWVSSLLMARRILAVDI